MGEPGRQPQTGVTVTPELRERVVEELVRIVAAASSPSSGTVDRPEPRTVTG
ncbi:hypothetical protein [Streptosporangium sp. NPDC023615]|uniref:hypothetical protein n=1 Tax=Streptosporangium sp. NPDC023615 TaxID=3154794 RepID=UPI0034390EB0